MPFDPCFVICLADEGRAQLESCLGFLRSAYPDAPVKVISDGVTDPSYRPVCKQHSADYVQGAYLKRLECGGDWWQRTLSEGLSCDRPWIVKIDPDARVWRPFRAEPRHSIAGTLENAGTEHENVQGGIQAIDRDAARRIVDRGRFDRHELRSEWTFSPSEAERRQWRALAYLSTDKTLGWLARDAGIDWGDWSEVGSRWLPPAPANGGLRFAATHPHKLEPAPQFLDATLDVITTCKGRLSHLKQTLPGWLEPGVRVTVVDYDCPDGTTAWLRANHPEVRVVRVSPRPTFSLPRARNIGAESLPKSADWLCFFDADWLCLPDWSNALRARLRAGRYLLANPINWSQFGSVVVRASDFRNVRGYDPMFTGWGAEDGDFYSRLRHVGVRPGSFPGKYFSSIKHDDDSRLAHYDDKDKSRNQRLHDVYHHKKVRSMLDLGRLTTPDEDRDLKLQAHLECEIDVPPSFYPSHAEAKSDAVVYGGLEDSGQGPDGATPAARLAAPSAPSTAIPATVPAPVAAATNPSATGPMMTFALHARDARMEWSVDIGHLIEKGLAADTTSPVAVVAPIEHVNK